MSIGDNIRTVRKLQGLTQKELARRLGISPVGVAQWENGLRNPKHETIKRIASALGVSVTVLYGLPERKQQINKKHWKSFWMNLLIIKVISTRIDLQMQNTVISESWRI